MRRDRWSRRHLLFGSAALIGTLAVPGCGGGSASRPAGAAVAMANIDREPAAAPPEDLAGLVAGNNAFAWDLYAELARKPGNIFFSPSSISTAFAMAFAGARGETAAQMAAVLHFELPGERLHAAFNAFDQALTAQPASAAPESTPFQLAVASAAWGQQGFAFAPEYLETLARHYGSGVRLVDFAENAEGARETINAWVEDQTEDRIQDLLPEGSVDGLARLVLTNAIYFKADWLFPFDPDNTEEAPFQLADGGASPAQMMRQVVGFAYAEWEGVQVAELPYVGERASMVVLLPEAGSLGALESRLAEDELALMLAGLAPTRVDFAMPKLETTLEVALREHLQALGMVDAFAEPPTADFSGIDGQRDLFISDAFHKAFVRIDEKGTEAAAATGIVVGATSAPVDPPVVMHCDRPFVFLIRETTTGAILFAGRVTEPSAG
jgi:serpin B